MTNSPGPQDRLYLALYIRDGVVPSLAAKEDRHHWALLAIPSQSNRATRFHARDFFSSPDQTHWLYEEIHVDANGTPKLLAQKFIGDIVDMDRLFEILRDVPLEQDTPGWNCVSWIRTALDAMAEDTEVLSNGSEVLSWTELRDLALVAADAEVARRDSAVKHHG